MPSLKRSPFGSNLGILPAVGLHHQSIGLKTFHLNTVEQFYDGIVC